MTIRSPTKRAESTRSGGRRRAADDTSTVASGQGGGDDPTHEESYGRFKYQRNLYFFDTLERATPRRAHKKVKADGTGASAAADDGTSVFAKYHRSARRTPTARTVSALYDTLLLRSQQRAAEVQALHTHLDQRVRASMSIIDRISNTDHQQLRSRKDMLLAAISALSTHLRQLGEPIHQCELEHAQLMAVVSSTSSLLNEIASDLNDHLQPKLARITAKVQHLMAVRTGRGDATEFGWMVLAIALNFAANFTWWVFATVRGVKRLFWRGATAELLRNGDQQGATMGGVVNASGEDVSAVAGWTGSNARLGGKRFPMAVSSSDVTTTTLMSTRTSPSRDAAGASAVFGMNRRVRVVDPKEESGGNVAKRLQE